MTQKEKKDQTCFQYHLFMIKGCNIRVAQKHKKVKFENVPLSCGYMNQVEEESLKDCMVSIDI